MTIMPIIPLDVFCVEHCAAEGNVPPFVYLTPTEIGLDHTATLWNGHMSPRDQRYLNAMALDVRNPPEDP